MATNTSVRNALTAQIRAQYGGSGTGSGNWDDAGYDRAGELADLLINAGVTNLGELQLVDTPYQTEGNIAVQEKYPGAHQAMVEMGSGDSSAPQKVWVDANGNPINGVMTDEYTGEGYVLGNRDTTGRQLMIGDKAVGYLGDYNNDGTFGSKASQYMSAGKPGENLLGWSARGDGNTSYRVVTDPATGKLVISPGWNSSSDAASFRKAGIFLGGAALGGAGISGSLAGAAGLAGTAGGAALSGAATGAGLNMATTRKVDKNTLKAGAIGGLGGYLGHVGGDWLNSLTPGSTGPQQYLPGVFDTASSGSPLNMAMIESGLGTPGYGFNAGAAASGLFDPSVIGAGAGLMYGPGGTIVPYDPAVVSQMTANDPIKTPPSQKPASEWTDAEWDEYLKNEPGTPNVNTGTPAGDSVSVTGSRISSPVNVGGAIGAGIGATLPYEQVVDVQAQRYPAEDDPTYYPGDPFFDSLQSNLANNTDQTPIDRGEDAPTGQNDPHNDNLDPDGMGPGPATPDWGDKIKDWVLKNPKLAMTLAGSLLGKAGGNNTPAPPAPGTGPQAGFTATPAPSLGRQYMAPPPGYRPGFDPEHRYFTGIGAVGTGG